MSNKEIKEKNKNLEMQQTTWKCRFIKEIVDLHRPHGTRFDENNSLRTSHQTTETSANHNCASLLLFCKKKTQLVSLIWLLTSTSG